MAGMNGRLTWLLCSLAMYVPIALYWQQDMLQSDPPAGGAEIATYVGLMTFFSTPGALALGYVLAFVLSRISPFRRPE
jgi:hypothetical protein